MEILECKSSCFEYNTFPHREKVPLCILVFGCAILPKYKDEIDGILQTWGKLCDKYNVPYYIFVGQNIEEYKENIHIVSLSDKNVKDDYLSASYKQYIGMQWILSRYDPDFMCIVGSDTWISPNNMLKLISKFNPDIPYYIGRALYICMIVDITVRIHTGGAGIILSRKALDMLTPYLFNIQSKWTEIADKYYGVGNKYTPSCDVSMALLCHLLKFQVEMDFNMYHNKFDTEVELYSEKYNNIITSHFMGKEDCIKYYNYLIQNGLVY